MKRVFIPTYFGVLAFLFVTTIISLPTANTASLPEYSISPIQEQNYQELLLLLGTFQSPEKEELMTLMIQIHEAILQGDYNTVADKSMVGERLWRRLPVSEQQAVDQFLDAHAVGSAGGALESSKGSCSVTCDNGSCSITCDPGQTAHCYCDFFENPVCECSAGTPTLSQWVLIFLALSVAGFFVWQLRRRKAVISHQ